MFQKQTGPLIPQPVQGLPLDSTPKSATSFPNLHPAHLKPQGAVGIAVTNFISEPRQTGDTSIIAAADAYANAHFEQCGSNFIMTERKTPERTETSRIETVDMRTEEEEACFPNVIYETQARQQAMTASRRRRAYQTQPGPTTYRSARPRTSCRDSPRRAAVHRMRMTEVVPPIRGSGSLSGRVPANKTTQDAYGLGDTDSDSEE